MEKGPFSQNPILSGDFSFVRVKAGNAPFAATDITWASGGALEPARANQTVIMNEINSERPQKPTAPELAESGSRARRRKRNRQGKTCKGRKGPTGCSSVGSLPGKGSRASRPSCHPQMSPAGPLEGPSFASDLTFPLPSEKKASGAVKPGSLPARLTQADGSRKWECSLTPQVLRAYAGLSCGARRRHHKLMGDLEGMIRNARSHEEQEMIMDRSVVAAVTFQGKASRQPASRKGKKRQGKPECKGRWTCRRWASNLIAFGARDLPSSATRWEVREAYLQFVEDHRVPPGYEELMTVTGLSAKSILGVLPGIEEELGHSGSAALLELGQASSAGSYEALAAVDVMEHVKKVLAEAEVYDRILWMLRFEVGYGPDSIVELLRELRTLASLEATANALESLVGEWPDLGRECRDGRQVAPLLRLASPVQVRCRLFRLNKRVKDRLRALGYRD